MSRHILPSSTTALDGAFKRGLRLCFGGNGAKPTWRPEAAGTRACEGVCWLEPFQPAYAVHRGDACSWKDFRIQLKFLRNAHAYGAGNGGANCVVRHGVAKDAIPAGCGCLRSGNPPSASYGGRVGITG